MRPHPIVSFTVVINGTDHQYEVIGQCARSLLALVEAGQNGVTALEVSGWAFRLAAYCCDLRHRYGLAIRTEREEHAGGWHGRYFLETPVQIDRVEGAFCWRGLRLVAEKLNEVGADGTQDPSAIDEEKTSFSWGGFSRVPKAAVFDKGLTDGEFRKLAAVCCFSDKYGVCYPSHGRIAEFFGITRQGVQKLLAKVYRTPYLTPTPQRRSNGSSGPNLYQINYPPLEAPQAAQERAGGGGVAPDTGEDEMRASDSLRPDTPAAT